MYKMFLIASIALTTSCTTSYKYERVITCQEEVIKKAKQLNTLKHQQIKLISYWIQLHSQVGSLRLKAKMISDREIPTYGAATRYNRMRMAYTHTSKKLAAIQLEITKAESTLGEVYYKCQMIQY